MSYYDTAAAYEMTTAEAMSLDAAVEPLWKVSAAAAHLSRLDVAPLAVMAARMQRREALEAAFWGRKLAGEGLA